MHAHIIYNYLTPDGKKVSVGGVQTYITHLLPLLRESHYAVTIYQLSTQNFHQEYEGYDVYGIKLENCNNEVIANKLSLFAFQRVDVRQDIIIYGTDFLISSKAPCRSIAIQHGIAWDIPLKNCSNWRYFKHYLGKCKDAWHTIQRIRKVDQLVCVDYNFVNWHRAVAPYSKTKHIVIPNFSEIPPSFPQKSNSDVQVIFARRLFTYRGTRLFANVAEKILDQHPEVSITIAGTGPDESYMRKKLEKFNHVEFITYDSQESLMTHEGKDIAVVPTLGSEGTSLSLLEAMAAGCAVVCTNVGGMTNIVLDGYNGVIINPEEDALYTALNRLITDNSLRGKLQVNAYNTVKEAFSLENWQKKWQEVINSIQ